MKSKRVSYENQMFSHVSYRGDKLCRTIASYESPLSRINKGQLRTSPFHSESKKTTADFSLFI